MKKLVGMTSSALLTFVFLLNVFTGTVYAAGKRSGTTPSTAPAGKVTTVEAVAAAQLTTTKNNKAAAPVAVAPAPAATNALARTNVAVSTAPAGAVVAATQANAAQLTAAPKAVTTAVKTVAPVVAPTQVVDRSNAVDAGTQILSLVQRIGAAKGNITQDVQAGLPKQPAAVAAAQTDFFAQLKNIFTSRGLAVTDTGYRLTRYQLRLLLKLVAGQVTAADLTDICNLMLAGGQAAHPEFGAAMVNTYTVNAKSTNGFLAPANLVVVQGWITNGYNNDTTYFAAQNCAKPVVAAVTTSATLSTSKPASKKNNKT